MKTIVAEKLTENNKNIVCPKCGMVIKEGVKYAQAYSLYFWTRQGFKVQLCPDCEGK